jgi:hypothetical protein
MKIFLRILGIPLGLVIALVILILLAAPIFFMGKLIKNQLLTDYGFNLSYSVDQLANAFWLGEPDETISSRTGRALKSKRYKWWVPYFGKLVDFLAYVFAKDKNHVRTSIEQDEKIKKELDSWSGK